MVLLKLVNINKSYAGFALKNVNLEVNKGDYFVLLGKSGSGKSMLLEIIAGVRTQDSGSVFLNETDLSLIRIQNRNCILVYQDTALFPHLSVFENIAFTLKTHKVNRKEISSRIHEMASYVSIEHILNRMPANLSGGEAQRAALARALIVKPDILLLDEPLSALDVQLRGGMQSLLHKINLQGQTIIHVTHDFDETLSLSNKVAILDDGKILQQGYTQDVFHHPCNEFVAGLSGLKNFFKSDVLTKIFSEGVTIVQLKDCDLKINILDTPQSDEGFLTFNASDVILSSQKTHTSAVNNFQGIVTDIVPRANGVEVIVDIGVLISALVSKKALTDLEIQPGKMLWVSFKASACRFIENA